MTTENERIEMMVAALRSIEQEDGDPLAPFGKKIVMPELDYDDSMEMGDVELFEELSEDLEEYLRRIKEGE